MLATLLVCSTTVLAQAEADHAAIAKASLEQYIRPGYAHLAESTEALNQSVTALCRTPSEAALKDAKEAFAATVQAWSMVEPIRFGPVAEQHRYERIFYWPDPKGLGARQMREALDKAGRDGNRSRVAFGQERGAARPAGARISPLWRRRRHSGKGRRRSHLPLPLRRNHRRQCCRHGQGHRFEAGSDGAPYAKAYLEPGPADAAYHTPKEVTLELFKTFATGIEMVRDQKIGKPLGAKSDAGQGRSSRPSGGAT